MANIDIENGIFDAIDVNQLFEASKSLSAFSSNFDTWKGNAATSFKNGINTNVQSIETVQNAVTQFNQVLDIVQKYTQNQEIIEVLETFIENERANPSKIEVHTYTVNGVEHTEYIKVVDEAKIAAWQSRINKLQEENIELKEKANLICASIGTNNTVTGNTTQIQKGELSYADAQALAKKLQVPTEYITSLHLHEGYKIGDRLIPDNITPDVIHYAGEHGYPIIIDGIADKGDIYTADAPERNTTFIKTAEKFSVVGGGREYNIQGWPITFNETDGRNVYWTWYGPIAQGFGGPPAPIQCTATDLYPCDDGHYRDKDGYIVIAGSPYKNQFYDGVHVDFSKNGGMDYEDMFVVTPLGLGRFYDNGAIQVENGIESDFYRNDGYESNTIAKSEYGRRLRESAVEGYESLNLYWNQMIH